MNQEQIPLHGEELAVAAWLSAHVSAHRYRHSLGVLEAVTGLASHHQVDPAPLRLAALMHDAARELDNERMLALAREWELPVREVDEQAPVLLHGRVALAMAQRELGLTDPAFVSAVKYHTAGHPRMSFSDKLFFLADHIEPGRGHPHIVRLRRLVNEDIDASMLYAIERTELYLTSIGGVADPDTDELKAMLAGNR